jgi:hypothetical protein
MGYANEWSVDVSLNQAVNWTSTSPLIDKALKAIREKSSGPDTILSTSFIFKFDCLQPECQMDYAPPEIPDVEWSKLGESFSFSTDADTDKEAKKIVAGVTAAFSEHFEKPKATFKAERDGSSCVLLHVGLTITRRLEGKVSFKLAGRDFELFGGKDPPKELSVAGTIKICCCVCEEVGEEPHEGEGGSKTPTGAVSKCDYSVTVRRWDEEPEPSNVGQLYWTCSAPLGSCGKTKKVGQIPLTTPQSGMPKK